LLAAGKNTLADFALDAICYFCNPDMRFLYGDKMLICVRLLATKGNIMTKTANLIIAHTLHRRAKKAYRLATSGHRTHAYRALKLALANLLAAEVAHGNA
jgi:hypothetical protein